MKTILRRFIALIKIMLRRFIAWVKIKIGSKVVIITETITTSLKVERFIALMKIKVGREIVTIAGTTITFSSKLSSSDYAVYIRCFGIKGNNISFILNEKTDSGFKITPVVDSTIEYIAILYI